jgi:hypothetical protein
MLLRLTILPDKTLVRPAVCHHLSAELVSEPLMPSLEAAVVSFVSGWFLPDSPQFVKNTSEKTIKIARKLILFKSVLLWIVEQVFV